MSDPIVYDLVFDPLKNELSVFKDPNSILDYTIKWTDWMAEGDTIASIQFVAVDPALVIVSQGFLNQAADDSVDPPIPKRHEQTAVIKYVTTGPLPAKASATYRVVTTGAPVRTEDQTIVFKLKPR